MGLRLKEGIGLDEFYNRFQVKLTELYGERILKLQQIGMLNLTEHNLALTEKALFVSNSVIGDLIL
jgi:oxygen-independent coproporphyrinogen-3 oxidase